MPALGRLLSPLGPLPSLKVRSTVCKHSSAWMALGKRKDGWSDALFDSRPSGSSECGYQLTSVLDAQHWTSPFRRHFGKRWLIGSPVPRRRRVGGTPCCGQVSYVLLCYLDVSQFFSVGLWPSILGVDNRRQHSDPALICGVTTQHLHRWVLTRWKSLANPPASMLGCCW